MGVVSLWVRAPTGGEETLRAIRCRKPIQKTGSGRSNGVRLLRGDAQKNKPVRSLRPHRFAPGRSPFDTGQSATPSTFPSINLLLAQRGLYSPEMF